MDSSSIQTHNQQAIKQRNRVWFVLILGSLTAFGPLSLDMYLPGLPAVTKDLGATASLGQLSLTTCLLGLGAGQLLFGPLSDVQGRRKLLITTLILYGVVSVLSGFSTNIWVFIILRFFQGFTGAAGLVIARASARDIYSGKDLTQFIALLALVNGAAPILAPIFGGVILNWFSWEVVFFVLGAIGFIMFAVVFFFLPETLAPEDRVEGNIFSAFKSFKTLFQDRVFMGIASAQALVSMGLFAYIAASPFVLQNIYGVNPQQFSLIFGVNGIGIIISAQAAGRLSTRFSEVTLFRAGILQALLGSTLLLFVVFLDLPIWVLMIAFFTIVSSIGMVSTTSFSLAMNRQGKVAGSASAFLGIMPFVGGAIVSPLVGIAGENSSIPMGVVIFGCSAMAFVMYRWMRSSDKAV